MEGQKKMEIKTYYDAKKISKVLCILSSGDGKIDDKIKTDIEQAIYQLQAIASNEYNADYYRTLWNVLQKITDYHTL